MTMSVTVSCFGHHYYPSHDPNSSELGPSCFSLNEIHIIPQAFWVLLGRCSHLSSAYSLSKPPPPFLKVYLQKCQLVTYNLPKGMDSLFFGEATLQFSLKGWVRTTQRCRTEQGRKGAGVERLGTLLEEGVKELKSRGQPSDICQQTANSFILVSVLRQGVVRSEAIKGATYHIRKDLYFTKNFTHFWLKTGRSLSVLCRKWHRIAIWFILKAFWL